MKFNWGHGILVFIIFFLLLSTIFIIFSLNQAQDLVAEDYYDKGAGYSSQIEVNKRSSVYQDSISINTFDSSIHLELSQDLALSGDTLYVHFYRPSDKNADLKIKFPMQSEINFQSSALKKGRYIVKMSWNHLGDLYNIEKEIIIK